MVRWLRRSPLTRAGWLLAAGSIAAIVTGRLLGILELTLLGIGGVVLLGVAVLLTIATATSLVVRRVLSTGRATAGDNVEVRIEVQNRGRRPTPELEVHDRVGSRVARMLAPPLAPGASEAATYLLPTPRRGRVTLGPIDIVAGDPFGLTRRSSPRPGTAEVIVVPRIVSLTPLPRVPVEDAGGSSTGPRRLTNGAGEFHSLRPYALGDDLRLVHWATAARTGSLVVRQNEQLWDSVSTVVLDDRPGAHAGDRFEDAITAAASIAAAAQRSGARFRVVTPSGLDTGLAAGAAHLDRVLHHLAVLEAGDRRDLGALAGLLDRRSSGAVALLLGRVEPASAAAVRTLLGETMAAVVISSDPGSAPRTPTVPVLALGDDLARDWAAALMRLRTARMSG